MKELIVLNPQKFRYNKNGDFYVYKVKKDKFLYAGNNGFCIRKDIGIQLHFIETYSTKHEVPQCEGYSLKGIRGHFDWSRFPQGGNVGDRDAKKIKRRI